MRMVFARVCLDLMSQNLHLYPKVSPFTAMDCMALYGSRSSRPFLAVKMFPDPDAIHLTPSRSVENDLSKSAYKIRVGLNT